MPQHITEQPGGSRQGNDLGSLFEQYRSAMDTLTDEWGYVVVRTACTADTDADAAQWADALAKLRAYALMSVDEDNGLDPDDIALPVIADRNLLEGADYATVRTAFNAWTTAYWAPIRASSDTETERPWSIRREVCIVVDEAALASLLAAPEPSQVDMVPDDPWVVVVDATDPATVGYNGGGPYMGWMRASASALSCLASDLVARTMAEFLCPIREYDGQIPLYGSFGDGKMIDPPGGLEGRYKFPRGTPRGREAAWRMLAEIERAIGGTKFGSGSNTLGADGR